MGFPWEKSNTQKAKETVTKSLTNSSEFLFCGYFCGYTSLVTKDLYMGLQSGGEFLCVEGSVCIAMDGKPWPMKLDLNQQRGPLSSAPQYCLASLPCCEFKIKKPETLIAWRSKILKSRHAQHTNDCS